MYTLHALRPTYSFMDLQSDSPILDSKRNEPFRSPFRFAHTQNENAIAHGLCVRTCPYSVHYLFHVYVIKVTNVKWWERRGIVFTEIPLVKNKGV